MHKRERRGRRTYTFGTRKLTLCRSGKIPSIETHCVLFLRLISVISDPSDSIMPQLFKEDLIINCVKCFLEVNKNPARKFVLVNYIFDTINKIYNGMGSRKTLPRAELF